MEISPILIPVSAIVGAFAMIILLRKFENDERMAMIEKGLNPHMPKPRQPRSTAMVTFHFAAIAIGVSLGLLVGNVLYNVIHIHRGIAYLSMVLMFGGLGLLVSYFVQLKHDEKERNRKADKPEKQYLDV